METKKVGFTLGESAGKLLVDIAREHLLYSYDPDKAYKAIANSLMGCPRNIVLDIILGKKVLLVDEDKVTFNCVDFNPEVHGSIFERLHPETWAERKLLDMKKMAKEWKKGLQQLGREIIRKNGKYSFTVNYDHLMVYFYDGTAGNLIDIDVNDDAIAHMRGCVVGVRNFLTECFKISGVIDWMHKNFVDEVPDGFLRLPSEVRNLSSYLFEIMMGDSEIEDFIQRNSAADELVTSYLKAESAIRETVNSGIKPVDILQNWSAGWLSPTGDYYALNGEKANMLHNQIADALVEANIITPKTHDNGITETPERWLEVNGWVKIHGDWILYDGWNLPKVNKEAVPMTKEQKQKIYEYGQVCCGGVLMLGYTRERISAARFDMTELPMMKKYFEV